MSKPDDSGQTPEISPKASGYRLDASREQESQPEQSSWAERFSSSAFGNFTARGLSEVARQLSGAAAKSLPQIVFDIAKTENSKPGDQQVPRDSGGDVSTGEHKPHGGGAVSKQGSYSEAEPLSAGEDSVSVNPSTSHKTPGEGSGPAKANETTTEFGKRVARDSETKSDITESSGSGDVSAPAKSTEAPASKRSTESSTENTDAAPGAQTDPERTSQRVRTHAEPVREANSPEQGVAQKADAAPEAKDRSKPEKQSGESTTPSGEEGIPPTSSNPHQAGRAPAKDSVTLPESPLKGLVADPSDPKAPRKEAEPHKRDDNGGLKPAPSPTDNSNETKGSLADFVLPKAIPLNKDFRKDSGDLADSPFQKDNLHGPKSPTNVETIKSLANLGSPTLVADENGGHKKLDLNAGVPNAEKDPVPKAVDASAVLALIGKATAASGSPEDPKKGPGKDPGKDPVNNVEGGIVPSVSKPHNTDSQVEKGLTKLPDTVGGQQPKQTDSVGGQNVPSPAGDLLPASKHPEPGTGSQAAGKIISSEPAGEENSVKSKAASLNNTVPSPLPVPDKSKSSGDDNGVLSGLNKLGFQKEAPEPSNQGAKLGESLQNLLTNKGIEGKQVDNGEKTIPADKQTPAVPQEIKQQDNKQDAKLPEIKEPSEIKKKDEEKTTEHERLLQELFAQGVPAAPKHEEAEHNANPKVVQSNEKFEMASSERDNKNPISQFINKIESVVENKIANIVQAVSERSHGTSEARAVSSAQAPLSKSDLPLFQQPIIRINEIASELKRVSINDAAGASLADLSSKSGRLTAAEAVSLKDLIAANRQIDPSVIKGAISVDGKGLPLDGKAVISIDGKGGIDGKSPLDLTGTKIKFDPSGKVEELTPGKNGKVDPPTGIKSGASDDLSIKDDKRGGLKGSDDKVEDGDGKIRIEDEDDSFENEDDDDDRKDLLDQNSDNDNLELILAGKIKKKDLDVEEEKAAEEDGSNENETRKKYIVQEGDTLPSIAKSVLGDSRYDRLIEMVNRGQLKYHYKEGTRSVALQTGQIIWLPTSRELKVFSSLYFTKGASSKVLSEKIKEEKPGAQSVEELIATLTQSIESVASYDTKTKQDDQTTAIDFAPLERRKKKTRPSFANSQTEAAHYSTGEWQEIEQFLTKLKNVAEEGIKPSSAVYFQSKDIELPLIAEDNLDIKILSIDTRIVVEYTMDLDEDEVFHARLQRQYDTEWKTVAYYQSSSTKAFRYLHKQSGGRKTFQLHLPNTIVREMALKDLSRNWRTYVSDFESNDLPKVVRNVPIVH